VVSADLIDGVLGHEQYVEDRKSKVRWTWLGLVGAMALALYNY